MVGAVGFLGKGGSLHRSAREAVVRAFLGLRSSINGRKTLCSGPACIDVEMGCGLERRHGVSTQVLLGEPRPFFSSFFLVYSPRLEVGEPDHMVIFFFFFLFLHA
jgi:hypothetical protein